MKREYDCLADAIPEGDYDWCIFILPVVNMAEFGLPLHMRLGQRIMNAITERHPDFGDLSATQWDIWEVDALGPEIEAWFERVFELYIEGL